MPPVHPIVIVFVSIYSDRASRSYSINILDWYVNILLVLLLGLNCLFFVVVVCVLFGNLNRFCDLIWLRHITEILQLAQSRVSIRVFLRSFSLSLLVNDIVHTQAHFISAPLSCLPIVFSFTLHSTRPFDLFFFFLVLVATKYIYVFIFFVSRVSTWFSLFVLL